MLDWSSAEPERCKTANLINRLHITLENIFAPVELCALIDESRERGLDLPPPAAHWLGGVDTLLRGGGPTVQPFERRMINKSAAVYAAPGTEAERSGRTVVVAFTGDAHRLMMPISLLLQQCPADRYEFLMVFDPRRSLYLRGSRDWATVPGNTRAHCLDADPLRRARAGSSPWARAPAGSRRSGRRSSWAFRARYRWAASRPTRSASESRRRG
ncbi:MAG: hypothetical protein IPF73_07140 [Betaproteobacteria bacterium]|nr:hypothetical protein [Betaproteobacteria bacterium]